MGLVYILQSLKNFRYYIGSTNDLERRVIEHNSGHTSYDRANKPFQLLFHQTYSSLKEARKIEKKIKKAKSKKLLEQIILDGIIKLKV